MNFEELVDNERIRQDEMWGEQNHKPEIWLPILMEEVGELSTAILDYFFNHPKTDKDIGTELVQVAAVAKVMWESGVRRGWILNS